MNITIRIRAIVTLAVISSFFISCNPYVWSYSEFSHCSTSDCFNYGLVDTTFVDTSEHEKKIASFFAMVDTSTRSTEILGRLLIETGPEIASSLKTALIKDSGQCMFSLKISPEGNAIIENESSSDVIDTVLIKKAVQ